MVNIRQSGTNGNLAQRFGWPAVELSNGEKGMQPAPFCLPPQGGATTQSSTVQHDGIATKTRAARHVARKRGSLVGGRGDRRDSSAGVKANRGSLGTEVKRQPRIWRERVGEF